MRNLLAIATVVAAFALNTQSNAMLVALTVLLLGTRGVTIFLMHPAPRRLRRHCRSNF
jgi:hypothetical protein